MKREIKQVEVEVYSPPGRHFMSNGRFIEWFTGNVERNLNNYLVSMRTRPHQSVSVEIGDRNLAESTFKWCVSLWYAFCWNYFRPNSSSFVWLRRNCIKSLRTFERAHYPSLCLSLLLVRRTYIIWQNVSVKNLSSVFSRFKNCIRISLSCCHCHWLAAVCRCVVCAAAAAVYYTEHSYWLHITDINFACIKLLIRRDVCCCYRRCCMHHARALACSFSITYFEKKK